MNEAKENINIKKTDEVELTDKTFVILAKIKKCYPFPAKFHHEREFIVEFDDFDESVIGQSDDWIKNNFGLIWVGRIGSRGKWVNGRSIFVDEFYTNSTENMRKFAKYIVNTQCLLLSRVSRVCQKKEKGEEGHECGKGGDCVYGNKILKEKLFFSAYPLLRRYLKIDHDISTKKEMAALAEIFE